MINATDKNVIINMAMTPATVRFNGQDIAVLRPATHGFCFVEFSDGEAHPISHPLEEWILSAAVNSGATPGSAPVGTVYFRIVPPGDLSNDGQDDKPTSVNNIQTAM
jgi:hypothetical protein